MVVQNKIKQYLLAFAKVLVLSMTFGYVFYRLRNNANLNFSDFVQTLFSKSVSANYLLLFFLFLAIINWFFEILKWKTLVSSISQISFKTALKQSLASLTVSLATPNRIGEYGAKALFFEKVKRKKVMLLNFYSNAIQLSITVLFGGIGFFYFLKIYNIPYSYSTLFLFVMGLFSLIGIGYFIKEKEILVKGFSIAKVIRNFQNLPNYLKIKVFLFSIFRYLVFSGMFYGLLLFFGAKISLLLAMALIFSMYLLVSIVPTIFIFDVVIRGGIAVWLFSFAGVSDLIVLSTVLAMWLYNFVLPSILGSFFVLKYQPITQ